MLRETSFVVPLVVLMVFATVVGGPCLAAAQDSSASVQSAASMVKNSSLLTPASVQPAPLQPTRLVPSLAINRHALSMAPPTDIAATLAGGNLPSPSGKEHPLLSLSKTSLLAPTKVQPEAFRDFSVPGLNASKLRSAKQPDLSSIQ
jgi:hypothetical protein